MKIMYSVLCVSLLAASCQQAPPKDDAVAPLQTDSSFVVGSELPPQDSATTGQVASQSKTSASSSTKAKTQTSGNNTSGTGTGNTQAATGTTAKKGWSKTAKGAVIGGVVGAGTGAVINKKNRTKGAILGGVIGAGGGAILGHELDKKDGRH
jgi:hypothetical protein